MKFWKKINLKYVCISTVAGYWYLQIVSVRTHSKSEKGELVAPRSPLILESAHYWLTYRSCGHHPLSSKLYMETQSFINIMIFRMNPDWNQLHIRLQHKEDSWQDCYHKNRSNSTKLAVSWSIDFYPVTYTIFALNKPWRRCKYWGKWLIITSSRLSLPVVVSRRLDQLLLSLVYTVLLMSVISAPYLYEGQHPVSLIILPEQTTSLPLIQLSKTPKWHTSLVIMNITHMNVAETVIWCRLNC